MNCYLLIYALLNEIQDGNIGQKTEVYEFGIGNANWECELGMRNSDCKRKAQRVARRLRGGTEAIYRVSSIAYQKSSISYGFQVRPRDRRYIQLSKIRVTATPAIRFARLRFVLKINFPVILPPSSKRPAFQVNTLIKAA